MRLGFVSITICLAAALIGCQSIKIHTGPPTDEESIAYSTERGSKIRSEWTDRLRGISVPQQAVLLKTFMDSTSASYMRYGFQIANKWRDESDRRGSEIPVADIRQMIENSTRTDLPLFEAYEDVLEYGLDGIRESRFFERRTEEMLLRYRDHYLDVYSAVFYPNGDREEFEDRLRTLQRQSENLSLDLEEVLRRYN
jgi:uncharacterized protein YceK